MKYLSIVNTKRFLMAALITAAYFVNAQTDHEKHHPKPPASSGTASMAMGAAAPDSGKGMSGGTKGGGMMEGMGDMMKEMGKAPTKEMYPAMMQLNELSAEKIDEIRQLANDQVEQGNAMLTMGLRQLSDATRRQDRSDMQEANEQIQRGQILLQSGLEGQRALVENGDPRITALQWFNREMNLPTAQVNQPHGFFGLSWFHYMVMLLFAAFAVVMVWMYFHKMKRANALVEKLTGDSNKKTPLPGAAKNEATQAGAIVKPDNKVGTAAPDKSAVKPETDSKEKTQSGTGAKVEPDAKATKSNTEMAPSKPNAWSGVLLVSEIFIETPQVKTYRLMDPARGKLPFNFLPGQFITINVIPDGDPIKREYTIASSPTNRDYCEITVKHEDHGTVSHYLHTQTHEGELLQITAPSGKFTFTEPDSDSIVLIAGGVGVTPMMSV